MTMKEEIRLIRAGALPWLETRRAGVSEKRVLPRGEGAAHNLILVRLDPGAEVELHPTSVPESLLLLEGEAVLLLGEGEHALARHDAAYCPPGSAHGLRAGAPGAVLLAVFSPPDDD